MVRFCRYLKLEPVGVTSALDMTSARERGAKCDSIFSGLTNFELPTAECGRLQGRGSLGLRIIFEEG